MGGNVKDDPVRSAALDVLESAWSPERGYCLPNADVYPHMWLWDSCFHSIAWASFLDQRSVRELTSALAKQFANGFLPHMVYAGPNTVFRGPRPDVSCFTQPPVYALAMAWARQRGLSVPGFVDGKVSRALAYFTARRFRDGLAFVVHPWETGCDDSPRWDSWYGGSAWNSQAWLARDQQIVTSTEFSPAEGDAIWNTEFVCAPSLFNGILSHAFWLVGELTGDQEAMRISIEIGDAMDGLLWDDSQGMYTDRPIVGGGDSHRAPTLDGVLSALGSVSRDRALACLDQIRDPARFSAPWGLRYLPAADPVYQPDAYWRGPAWPQLEFLAVQAARRWGQDDLADQIADRAKQAIVRSGWAEYWNPETGAGHGARPQTWAALAAAI
ncbi:MAG TPA: glycoside hydrolase 100 family protein [Streptosporangiaceae bacterium]|nr:glycoside hydrolase 100 family protein [Streptosporangiaceae bacterium]